MDGNWSLSSIIYQIYPKSFRDTNGDGVGDIQGIIEKLDYLEDLGINVIWLSPVYPSPQNDSGYDISDYKDIDPMFGKLADFDLLVKTAHERNIKIMMDFVPNHTSIEHSWFKESSSSRENDKRDWYIWRDPSSNGGPPNNWLSHFGGSAWAFDQVTQQYYLHLFDETQPDLNWRNEQVEKEMLDVLRFWMDRGVDGFRIDVPYAIYKDPLFSDEPPNPNYIEGSHDPFDMLLHTKTLWQDDFYVLMRKFVEVLQEYEGKFMVTETWTDLPGLVRTYTAVGWMYFQPFNFSLITLPWKADIHKKYIDDYNNALGDMYIPCWVLGNHDKPRIASRLGEKQARVAAMLELTLRGFPFIYYGEELGMTNGNIKPDEVRDPFEKKTPGLGLGRDPQRTPMQWDDRLHAGFTAHKPWLPIPPHHKVANAKRQQEDSKSFLSLYKTLVKLKRENDILCNGTYVSIPMPADNVLAFVREKDSKTVLILLNFDNTPKEISIGINNLEVLCDTSMKKLGNRIDLTKFTMEGDEGLVLSA